MGFLFKFPDVLIKIMSSNFDYISMHSIFVMTFLKKDNTEIDVADSEYDDKYIIDDLRFKKDYLNSVIKFDKLEDGLKQVFLKNNGPEFILEYIKIGLEQNIVKIEDLKSISVFMGSNNPNCGLHERESIEIDLVKKTIETESWDER